MRNISAPAPLLTRRKLYIAMVTASQLMWAGQSYASPEGGQVVGGTGKIDQSGKETIIHQQTDRMAIDWQGFDVKADERVQFIQPSASSLALNRVVSNKGSEILGRIDANGQVLLVNPNGVVFGKDSQINAGGILASGLNINPSEFMNGNFTLSAVEGTDGHVINSGVINAATGGSVTLLGKEVKNEGLIIANLGAVNLAVGKEAVVTFDSRGLVGVKVTKEVLQSDLGVDAALINSGEIEAQGGRILITASTSQDIFSQAVNHEGMNAATSVVVNDDGSFTLGGGANVINTGKISTSTTTGDAGQIAIVGDKVTSSGIISADSQNGNGGHIELNSKDTTIVNQAAIVSAQSSATGKGGDIKILGDKVGMLDTANVNASGATGGGQVLIGGDQTGKNKSINNANFIYLGENTNAKTDALLNGNGGKLITFAQDTARIYGNLSARGGTKSGDGGFIETSGLKGFEILNAPDTSAKNGLSGSWLIDPYNITITANSGGSDIPETPADFFTATNTKTNINIDVLAKALDGSTVTIATGISGNGAGNPSDGNITLAEALTYNKTTSGVGSYNNSGKASTLILNAANNIYINKNIERASTDTSTTGSLTIQLNANNGSEKSTTGGVIIATGVNIDTNGGNFTVGSLTNRVDSFLSTGATIDTSFATKGGAVSIYTTNDATLGSISFGRKNQDNNTAAIGNVLIDSSAGNINLEGSYLYYSNASTPVATMTLNAQKSDDATLGKIILKNTIIDNGAGDYSKLNLSFNAGRDVTINNTNTSASGIWLTGGNAQIISVLGKVLTNNSNATYSALESEGGNVVIDTAGDVEIKGNGINTEGGNFTVLNSASFTNNFTNSIINTSASIGGGAISITSAGNVTLGGLSFSDSDNATQTQVGSVTVLSSGGNVTLAKDLDFNNVGFLGSTRSFLDIQAKGDISIDGTISDSNAAARDTLNINFVAAKDNNPSGIFTLNAAKDIYTAGGNFSLSAQSINFNGRTIDTQNAKANTDSTRSNGGDVTLKSSTDFALGNIITDSTCVSTNNCTGNFVVQSRTPASQNISVSQTAGKTLNINGNSSFNIGSGNLTLGNNNLFSGSLSFIKANDVTVVNTVTTGTKLGASTIDGIFNLTSTGNISHTGALDITGAATLSVVNGNIALADYANDFKNTLSIGTNLGVNILDSNALVLDAFSVTGVGAAKVVANSILFNTLGAASITTNGGYIDLKATSGDLTVGELKTNSTTAGTITLAASGNILLNGNLSAVSSADAGQKIDIKNNVQLNSDVTINTSGSGTNARGDISFGGSVNSSAHKNLTLTGKVISFGGNLGDATTNRLGTLIFDSTGNFSASNRDFFATSFKTILASGTTFSAKDINTSNAVGGAVEIGGVDAGAITINSINSSATGTNQNGGAVTITGSDITLGSGNNTAIDSSATGLGIAGLVKITATDNAASGTPSIILKGNIISNGTVSAPAELKLVGLASAQGTIDFSQYTSSSDVTSPVKIIGSIGTDTFNAQNIASTWTIDGIANSVGNVSFSGIEKIVGGSAANIFNLNGGTATTLSMNIDGGSEADTFNISANTTGTIDGKAGADNFYVLLSNLTAADLIGNTSNATLTGPNVLNNWRLLATGKSTLANSANTKIINFTGMNKLVGGTVVDNFVLGSSGITKVIDGGTGAVGNTLTAFDDTNNNDTNWNLTNENSGTVINAGTNTKTVTFSKIETLNGGSGKDKFTFSTALFDFDGVLNGNGGNDTFALNHDVKGGVNGGDGDDTFDISVTITGDIHGNNGADTFNIKSPNLLLSIFGDTSGTDVDTVVAANNVNTWRATGLNSGTLQIGASSTFVSSFDDIEAIKGGTAADTLIANNTGANTWSLTDKNTGTLNGLNFSAIENLTGNGFADTFKFLADFIFDPSQVIDAVGTNNIVDISGISAAKNILITLSNNASDPIIISGVKNAASVIGNNNNSGITVASSSDTTWVLDSVNGNTVSNSAQSVSFTKVSSLTGSTATNSFNLTTPFNGSITGLGSNTAINNATDNSIWTLTNSNNGTLLSSGITTSFFNIKTLGGSETDQIKGLNGIINTWSITGKNAGSVALVNFTGMKNILGGNLADNFNFTAAGFIEGVIDGGNGTDTITAANTNNTWNLTSANAGTLKNNVTPQNYGTAFQNVENLVGGTANDLFKFSGGSIVDADGGLGTNTVSFEDSTIDVEVTLGAASINGVHGIKSFIGSNTNASTLKASNSTGTNTWKIFNFDLANNLVDGIDDGVVTLADTSTISFINFKNLFGGGGTDIFELSGTGAKLTGTINGGLGTNKIINNASTLAWVIDDSSATVRAGKFNTSVFANIDEINGSGNDTLTGGNQNNDWSISNDKSGDVHLTGNTTDKLTFTGVSKLIGQAKIDKFDVTSSNGLSIIIDGGAGLDNTLSKSFTGAGEWIITSAHTGKLNDTLTFSNINIFKGNNNDSLTGINQDNDWAITTAGSGNVHLAGLANTADQISFNNFKEVIGLAGIDIFTVASGASINNINGGTGNNKLVNQTSNSTWTLDKNVAFSGTLNSKTFEAINEIVGSDNADTLTGREQNNDWKIKAADEGTVQLSGSTTDVITFSKIKNITGNILADNFTFLTSSSSISGVIDGSSGQNSLIGRNTASTFKMNDSSGNDEISDSGTAVKYATFKNIQKITGGTGTDILIGSPVQNTWLFDTNNTLTINGRTNPIEFSSFENIQGGDGVDTFTFTSGFSGNVDGGKGNDIFNINAIVGNLLGGDNDDTFILGTSGKATSINGGANSNSLQNLNATKNNWVLVSANKGSITNSTNSTLTTAFEKIQTIKGNDLDSLTGFNQSNKWTITNKNSGTLNENITNPTDTMTFTGMASLIGNNSADSFDFSALNSSVTESINGGLGVNELKAHDGVVNVWSLGADNISGSLKIKGGANPYIPSFNNIQTRKAGNLGDSVVVVTFDLSLGTDGFTHFSGSDTDESTLIGFDKDNTWIINDVNQGSISNSSDGFFTFEGFHNLVGGNKSDSFNFVSGGKIEGNISGVSLVKTETAGTINSIKGIDAANSWQMTVSNSGSVTAAGATEAYAKFNKIQKIIGGGMVDLLIGTATGDVNTTQYWELGTTKNIFVLNGAATNIEFSGVENIQGGVGSNTLANKIANKSWLLTDANQGSINAIRFSNIATIQGSGTDSLTGRDQDNNWQINGANSGSVSENMLSPIDKITFFGMSNLIGNKGSDIFNLDTIGTVSSIDGGATSVDKADTLVGANISNKWVIDKDGLGTLNDNIKFTNFTNLTGGTAQDTFDIAKVGVIKGVIDGGVGSGKNTVDLIKIADNNIKVGVGATAAADIKIINVTEVNANPGKNNTLVADNTANNSWKITDKNTGTLNTNVAFTGFANLVGRDTQDTFIFDGALASLTGIIDGGTGDDTLNLLSAGSDRNVAILNDSLSPLANAINVTNIETLNASKAFTNTLTANDKQNTWVINTADGGTLTSAGAATPIIFSNFANLVGGKKDDLFDFSGVGSLSGYIDGGIQELADIVDLSKLSGKVDIVLGDLGKGYRNIEKFVGNNIDSVLYGDDNANIWNLTDTNAGNINDTIKFSGFTSLVGGRGADTFNLLQGQLTGSVSGGAGKDIFNVTNGLVNGNINGDADDDTLFATISDLSPESIRFVGGDGNNIVTVTGGGSGYIATHGSAISGGGSLRYDANSKAHTINYSNTKTVNDNLVADQLVINGTDSVDIFALSNNSYLLNNFTTVNYQSKNNLVIDGAANDKVSIATPVNIANLLTLNKVSVETTGAGVINANGLVLDGTASVGSSANRLRVNVSNLSVNATAGDIYIQEQSGLNISGFTTNNNVDLLLDGNLTSDVALKSIGKLTLETTGDITLNKENALSGELNFKAGKNIDFRNGGTFTTFGNLSANSLNLSSTGSLIGNGIFSVAGVATLESGADINLSNVQNDFNSILVTSAHDVNLVDKNLLTLASIGATGDIKTQSQGIVINGAINGAGLSVAAGTGAANIANSVNVQNAVSLDAQEIIVSGNILANKNITANSAGLFSQSGNLTGGDIDLHIGKYTVNTGVTTTSTSGAVKIDSASDIAAKNITAATDINLKAANDISGIGTLVATGGKIDLIAGNNIVLNSDVKAQTGINTSATNGKIDLQAVLSAQKGDVDIKAAGDVNMVAGAATNAAEGNISYTGKNLTVTALSALNGGVTFISTGSVIDANGAANNISAKEFTVDSLSGIGMINSDAIETNVARLSLSNRLGEIRVINSGTVTVDRMHTNGNIFFGNLGGDILLDNSKDPVFDKTNNDALAGGGTINAGYDLGNVSITIDKGNLFMAPASSIDKSKPVIVGSNADVRIGSGKFGELGRPLVIYVKNYLYYSASRYYKPTYAFGIQPKTVEHGAGPQSSLTDILSAGAEQLVVVEDINEINPAIFTNVRNYVYDDIAIMLPPDQRYDETYSNTN